MPLLRRFFCFLLLALSGLAFSADRVSGANATLNIVPGAGSAALGGAVIAQPEDLLGFGDNPMQLATQDYAWGSFSHVAYFEGTVYDMVSMSLPLEGFHGLGFSFSRFGADDIPWIKEGEPIPEGSDYRTLNMADWVFSVAYGRRLWKNLDFGVSLHGLYREMDQSGFGFRGDLGLRYSFPRNFSLSALLRGWTSSSAKWESGTFEYEAPELYVAGSWNVPIPYFYGSLSLYLQSAGILHREARDLDFEGNERGGRFWEEPLDFLAGSRGGVEFSFDFGLSLRAGLSSFTTWESFTLGAGLLVSKFLKVDYAFESHPVLSSVHRVSVSVSPWLFFKNPKEPKAKKVQSFVEKEEPVTEDSPSVLEKEETVSSSAPEESENTEVLEENNSEVLQEESLDEVLEPASGIYWEE